MYIKNHDRVISIHAQAEGIQCVHELTNDLRTNIYIIDFGSTASIHINPTCF